MVKAFSTLQLAGAVSATQKTDLCCSLFRLGTINQLSATVRAFSEVFNAGFEPAGVGDNFEEAYILSHSEEIRKLIAGVATALRVMFFVWAPALTDAFTQKISPRAVLHSCHPAGFSPHCCLTGPLL